MRVFIPLLFLLFSVFAIAQPPACTPPDAVLLPDLEVGCEGSSITLNGNYSSSNSSLVYKATWYKNGFALSVPTSSVLSYTIPTLHKEDEGWYVLRVENETSGSPACYKQDSVYLMVVVPTQAQILSPVTNGGTYYVGYSMTQLTANYPSAVLNEIGFWSIVKGNGAIMNGQNNPANELFTGNIDDTTRVRWTITNSSIVSCPPSYSEITVIRKTLSLANAGNDTAIYLDQASKTIQLKGSAYIKGLETASWKSLSSNVTLDVQDNIGFATFTQPGIYRFIYTIMTPLYPNNHDTVSVTVTSPLNLGETKAEAEAAHCYYDKSQEKIIVESALPVFGRLMQSNGTLVQEFKTNITLFQFGTAALTKGMYLLQLQTQTGRISKKLLVY